MLRSSEYINKYLLINIDIIYIVILIKIYLGTAAIVHKFTVSSFGIYNNVHS